jgi:hypothetical protein
MSVNHTNTRPAGALKGRTQVIKKSGRISALVAMPGIRLFGSLAICQQRLGRARLLPSRAYSETDHIFMIFTEASRERMTMAALVRVPLHPRSGELAFTAFFTSDLVIGSPSRSRFAWLLKFIFPSFISAADASPPLRKLRLALLLVKLPEVGSSSIAVAGTHSLVHFARSSLRVP